MKGSQFGQFLTHLKVLKGRESAAQCVATVKKKKEEEEEEKGRRKKKAPADRMMRMETALSVGREAKRTRYTTSEAYQGK